MSAAVSVAPCLKKPETVRTELPKVAHQTDISLLYHNAMKMQSRMSEKCLTISLVN